jgi:hypothetical protein
MHQKVPNSWVGLIIAIAYLEVDLPCTKSGTPRKLLEHHRQDLQTLSCRLREMRKSLTGIFESASFVKL